MKKLFALCFLFSAYFNVASSQNGGKIHLSYEQPMNVELLDIITEFNKHAHLYPQKSRHLYVKNHPGLRKLTGLGPGDDRRILKLEDYFRDHGYFINISRNPQKETRWIVQKFYKKELVKIYDEFIEKIFGGALLDTVYYFRSHGRYSANASSYAMHEIGEPGYITADWDKFSKMTYSKRKGILAEEIFESNLYHRYRDNLDILQSRQEDFGFGFPHVTHGKSQIVNLAGGMVNIIEDPTEDVVKDYLFKSINVFCLEKFCSPRRTKKHTNRVKGGDQNTLLSREMFRIARFVDTQFDRKLDLEMRKIRPGMNLGMKEFSKMVDSVVNGWTNKQYKEFIDITTNRLEELLAVIQNPDKKGILEEYRKQTVPIIISVLSVLVFLGYRKFRK